MATILRAFSSDQEESRCDSRCHFARRPECSCVCGGYYHGAGLEDGELGRRIDELAPEVLAQAKARFVDVIDLQRNPEPETTEQRSLWDVPLRRPSIWDTPTKRPRKW